MKKLRHQWGDLDVFSGLLFIIGLIEMQYDVNAGLILMGLGILKQFSGK